ncbi:MAG: metallophosphoesterase [Thermoflexales bacterium]|nr:metallophosphoesterase [Thermoflexales bacterium]
MRILAISDEVVSWMYGPALTERLGRLDLILSCGDLPIYYLEFIATAFDCPAAYVRGNHDHHEIGEEGAVKNHPEGWMPLDMHRRVAAGLALGGLDGCLRYNPDASNQYSQREQWWRAGVLAARSAIPRLRTGRGLDILVTHAPPYGIHNGPDHAHTGFHAHNWLMQALRPRYVLHGHQHRNYAPMQSGETVVDGVTVVNVHPYRVLEIQ